MDTGRDIKGRGLDDEGMMAGGWVVMNSIGLHQNNTDYAHPHLLSLFFLTQSSSISPLYFSSPGAIDHYTKCIEGLKRRGEAQSDLAMKAHANRAACYKQISNFDGVIEDCTAVLEVDPENVKALVRRAQAFEGVERYRFALQDIKTVLTMPRDKVGKANVDMCNMMQHRLNRTVQQLKAGNC